MSYKRFLFIAIVLLIPLISSACDLCGCFVPRDSMRRGFQFGVAEQFSSLSQISLDGEELPNNANQYLDSSYTQIFVNYHFNPRTALQFNLPLIYRSFQRVEGDAIQHGTESGIGDALVVGYYIPYQRSNPFSQFSWKLLGGLKFPTGNSDRIGEELLEGDESEPIES